MNREETVINIEEVKKREEEVKKREEINRETTRTVIQFGQSIDLVNNITSFINFDKLKSNLDSVKVNNITTYTSMGTQMAGSIKATLATIGNLLNTINCCKFLCLTKCVNTLKSCDDKNLRKKIRDKEASGWDISCSKSTCCDGNKYKGFVNITSGLAQVFACGFDAYVNGAFIHHDIKESNKESNNYKFSDSMVSNSTNTNTTNISPVNITAINNNGTSINGTSINETFGTVGTNILRGSKIIMDGKGVLNGFVKIIDGFGQCCNEKKCCSEKIEKSCTIF